MIRYFALFLILAGILSAQDDRTESQNSPFVVHGGNFQLRAAVIQDADEQAAGLDKLTVKVKEKENPIVIELLPPVEGKSAAIWRDFFIIPKAQGGGFRLQVNVRLARGNVYVRNELNRVLLEMLIIERSLRGRSPEEVVEQVNVSPWLIDGLQEAILWDQKRGDRRVYISLAQSGGWMEVEKLVEIPRVGEMDALGRELFRASSGALIMALLDQDGGEEAMVSYLREVATHEGEPLTLIRRHFPEVNLGRKGLEKWWSLAVAKMAEKPLTDSMTIPETEERLAKILRLHLKNEKGKPTPRPLEAWIEMADLPLEERIKVVRPTADLLTALSYRCFPTYREVVGGYLKVLADMAAGNPESIDESLGNLAEFRQGELVRMEKVTDLLDWYHLSITSEESGEFEDYLKLQKKLRERKTKKNDRVTEYVDKIQRLYQREKSNEAKK